ncbi:hypothetical protein BGP_1218 [Beggiatoa sp. PS]|nr:hypothetical protein BGP_1218 [Beggiatoa sp. PS]
MKIEVRMHQKREVNLIEKDIKAVIQVSLEEEEINVKETCFDSESCFKNKYGLFSYFSILEPILSSTELKFNNLSHYMPIIHMIYFDYNGFCKAKTKNR